MEPGTGISCEQIIGTWCQPCIRAPRAGKSASRSWVTVKMAQVISSGVSRLRAVSSWQSSTTASSMASRVLAATWVAPRIPRMTDRSS